MSKITKEEIRIIGEFHRNLWLRTSQAEKLLAEAEKWKQDGFYISYLKEIDHLFERNDLVGLIDLCEELESEINRAMMEKLSKNLVIDE